MAKRRKLMVDADGYVYCDGVKVGRARMVDGEVIMEVCDKNKHRSLRRGTRIIEYAVKDLAKAVQNGVTEY